MQGTAHLATANYLTPSPSSAERGVSFGEVNPPTLMVQRIELPMHFLALDQGFANARALRQTQTDIEKLFWEVVRGGRLDGLKFRRQHPIGPFIADFYCYQHKQVIELDGAVHNEIEQKAYGQNRDEWMREYGLTVLRLPNEAVQTSIEATKQ